MPTSRRPLLPAATPISLNQQEGYLFGQGHVLRRAAGFAGQQWVLDTNYLTTVPSECVGAGMGFTCQDSGKGISEGV